MKKIIILLFTVFALNVQAQNDIKVTIDSTSTVISTHNQSIAIQLYLKFSPEKFADYKLINEGFKELNPDLKSKLVSRSFKNQITKKETLTIRPTRISLQIEIDNVSEELIKLFDKDRADMHVSVNKDVFFKVWKEGDISSIKTLSIDRAEFEKATRNKLVLTDGMVQEFIDAKGGEIFLSQNQIDFGAIPSDQSSSNKTEFYAKFKYRSKYAIFKDSPMYFYSEGLIGTNSKDSLNHLSVYPVSFNFLKGTNELSGQLGMEGNQLFTNYRIAGNFYWNGIIPNLVDFTFGENRMRLKPVVKLGFKLYKEVENNRLPGNNKNEFSNQIFADFYYNIPIKKQYTLIFECSAFYDFNLSVNPDKKIMANYSATLGIEIPKTELQTIFKYTWGENGVTYKSNDYLMLGFIVDLFGINKSLVPELK